MKKRIDGKIAVFICGPVRYVTLVNERLGTVLKDCDYDCFFHLWKSDLGNKVRQGPESDYRELFDHPRAKVVIMQSPYSEDDFNDKIGAKTNSGSTINATMGMFFSVNVLCHYLKQLPDFEEYKYILRLRSDLAILNDDFATLLCTKPNVLTVANNSIISQNWLSDQICFGTVEQFFKLWFYKDMNDVYEAYSSGHRSPEQTLAYRYSCLRNDIVLNRAIVRFRDYHIVHFPPKDWEPECIVSALNTASMEEFFHNGREYIDFAQIDEFNKTRRDRKNRLDREGADKVLQFGSITEIANYLMGTAHVLSKLDTFQCKKAIALLSIEALTDIQAIAYQMLDSYPGHKRAKELFNYIETRLEAERLFEMGIDALNRGNASQSLTYFDKSISAYEAFPELSFARAVALVRVGKPILAIEACRTELELNPEHKGAKELWAKLEKAQLDCLQSIEDSERPPICDDTGGMTYLQFEITHICNRNCELCDHRIRYSDYKYLTKEEYKYLVSCVGDCESIRKILLIGGEPLCHPDFEWLVREIFKDFPNAKVRVQTNAKLIPRLPKDLIAKLIFRATKYDGFNDEVWEEYGKAKNFEWLINGPMWNPYRDPDLPEEAAKYIHKKCGSARDIRIVGTNMYGCCIAEGIERYYKTEPVHVIFDKNWKENFWKLPTWKACQHCFKAIDRFSDICAAHERGQDSSSATRIDANSEELEIATI